MSHTPGPWCYEYRKGDTPGNPSGWGANALWGPQGQKILGDDTGWEGGFSPPSEADARLIAAAPTMRTFIEMVSRLRVGDVPPYEEAAALLEQIDGAAIAKAEGR